MYEMNADTFHSASRRHHSAGYFAQGQPQAATTNTTKYQSQLEPDTKGLASSIPDEDIPEETRTKLWELLDKKYLHIISQNTMDIGRTNLIKLDIPTEDPLIASKPYTVLMRYCEFIDHKIKQLEEAGIISQSMSNWASPILVVPKKQDCTETNKSKGSSNFNLWLCID